MQFDESVLLQHHFKQLVVEGSKFLTIRSLEDFQIQAEKALNKRFDLAESWIYLIDFKHSKIYRFDHKTKERIEHDLKVGIIGKCISMNWEFNIENGYNDSDYND